MQKIKLLTFSGENSFGAMLQCYAMSKILSDWGYEVELVKVPLDKIDYGFIGNITFRISNWFFDKFRANNLPRFIHFQDSKFDDNDIFIVGSDQVWNPDITKQNALNYFFDFLPDKTKRISYAASFGNSDWSWKNIEDKAGVCLRKFSAISVREMSGAVICRDVFHMDADVVLDPTLLLDSYKELLKGKISAKKTLVYFSLFKETPKELELIRYIGMQTGSEPLMLSNKRFLKGIRTLGWLTVQNWVSQIANSSFVITNSFHCTVFAIIHHKQFIVIATNTKRAGRILYLLESLGLSNRYYPDIEIIYKSTDWLQPIDYDKIEEKLRILRLASFEFLKKALKE